MTSYRCSSQTGTEPPVVCRVDVDEAGDVVAAAPYLARRTVGRPWQEVKVELMTAGWLVEPLEG